MMKTHHKGFIVPLLLFIIAVLLVGGGAYVYTQNKLPEQASVATSTPKITATTVKKTSTQPTEALASDISVPGMTKYTDTDFGFSFWYPTEWQVATVSTNNPERYTGGTIKKTLTIVGPNVLEGGHDRGALTEVTIEEFSSPTFSITDNTGVGPCPVCVPVNYFFSPADHAWMVIYPDGVSSGTIAAGARVAADVSKNTMGGLHMLVGSQRFGANTIIPLSAKNFLVVAASGYMATSNSDPLALAKTIVASDPAVATPVSAAEQIKTIQAEAKAYSVSNTKTSI